MVQPNEVAYDFKCEAVMEDGSFGEIELSQYRGHKYVVLFFYPMDFTFVCPSEIVAFDNSIEEFKSRNCQVLGCSIDSKFTHAAWRKTPLNEGGIGPVKFPILADMTKQIARAYGCLDEAAGTAFRGLYLIDKEGVLKHVLINENSLGRSVTEAVRLLEALQFTEEHGEVCPANWRRGQAGIVPTARGISQYLSTLQH